MAGIVFLMYLEVRAQTTIRNLVHGEKEIIS